MKKRLVVPEVGFGLFLDDLESARNKALVTYVQVISLNGQVLGTGKLSVIDDTVIIDRLDVELVSGVQLSVEAKSDFPGAIAAQVTKTYQLHSYLQVLATPQTSYFTLTTWTATGCSQGLATD